MSKQYQKEYIKAHPWHKTMIRIIGRCGDKTRSYVNIRNFLKMGDLKYLWFRDRAYLMKRPSIDRIDANKDYTKDNCRYMELSQNISRREWVTNQYGTFKNVLGIRDGGTSYVSRRRKTKGDL